MLPVPMYHGLHDGPGARGRFDPVYSVRPADFAAQLDWLVANGLRGVRAVDATGDAEHDRIAITFDDGDASNLDVALPLLQARGLVATFFVTSDFVGQPGMLSSAGVRALADAGMEIGSHGRSHAFLADLPEAALRAELEDSRKRLQDWTGTEVRTLALPGGRGGERERRAALDAGYTVLFGSVPGPNRHPRAGAWLQRLAVTRELPLERYAALVRWHGWQPRLASLRHAALAVPKRVLGNRGYERLRERLL